MATSGAKRQLRQGGSAGSEETRRALVTGAIDALRAEGFSGATAREIARRARCNQGLIFYHFGSITKLLLAALDEVSRCAWPVPGCGRESPHLSDLSRPPGPFSKRTSTPDTYRARRDDRRRLVDPGTRRRSRRPHRSLAELRRRRVGDALAGTPFSALPAPEDVRLRHRGAVSRSGDARPPRRRSLGRLGLFDRARQITGLSSALAEPGHGRDRDAPPTSAQTGRPRPTPLDVVTGAFSYSGAAIATANST